LYITKLNISLLLIPNFQAAILGAPHGQEAGIPVPGDTIRDTALTGNIFRDMPIIGNVLRDTPVIGNNFPDMSTTANNLFDTPIIGDTVIQHGWQSYRDAPRGMPSNEHIIHSHRGQPESQDSPCGFVGSEDNLCGLPSTRDIYSADEDVGCETLCVEPIPVLGNTEAGQDDQAPSALISLSGFDENLQYGLKAAAFKHNADTGVKMGGEGCNSWSEELEAAMEIYEDVLCADLWLFEDPTRAESRAESFTSFTEAASETRYVANNMCSDRYVKGSG
jgi:hypothetical protein